MIAMMDYLLAVVLLVLGARLLWHGRRALEVSIMVFAGGFVGLGVSTLAAGVAHLLARQVGGAALVMAWQLGVLAVGLASFCLLAGVVLACSKGRWRQLLLGLAAGQLVLYCFWVLGDSDPRYVVYEYLSALAVVAVLEIWAWIGRDARSAPWILTGAVISGLVVTLQRSGLTIHSSVDHNAYYHLGQLVGLYLLYRGGRLLHDRMP